MEIRRYGHIFRRWAWMLVGSAVVAVLAAGIASKLLPPVYEAKVSLLVRPAQPLATVDPNTVALTSDQISKTYARLMIERPLLQGVESDLGLNFPVEDLQKEISVTPEPNTTILDVAVRSTNSVLARDTANILVRDFIAEIKRIQESEAQTPNTRSSDNLIVVAPATTPDKPVSPNVLVNVILAVAVALLAASALAFLFEYLDQSLKTDDEIAEKTGLLPIGHIQFSQDGKTASAELVALGRDYQAAEAYKSLRTNLLFSTLDREGGLVAITSPAPGEGKSRTAANLAVVLAEAGYRTLLVDADFRRPCLHQMFGRVHNIGLSNLILDQSRESELVAPTSEESNLFLLASGSIPPNPSELLGSGTARLLLARFAQSFRYVILDTPPVNAVTDAAVLSASTGASVLLVVEHWRTTSTALLQSKRALDAVGARIIGVVVNKVRVDGPERYAYSSFGLERSHLNRGGSASVRERVGQSTASRKA